MRSSSITIFSVAALVAAACGQSGPSAADLNDDTQVSGGTSGTGGSDATGGTGAPTGGSTPTGGAAPTGGSAPTGGATSTGGAAPTGGTSALGGSGGDIVTGGAGPSGGSGATPTGGSGGDGMTTGGTGGSGTTGGSGGAGTTGGAGGSGGQPPMGPYAPRSGTFKMLVYSRTVAFRHTDSIATGKTMLRQIAQEQGFTLTETETNTDITPTGLAQYEVLFFLNTTGDIFNPTEQQTFETWMTTKNGGFAGVHSATDTENGWGFYSEVTGQYYDLHEACCANGSIIWDQAAANHVAVRGMPSPWQRSEEWYNFNRSAEWTVKAGFQVLSRVTINNVSRPVSFVREYGNFRSFYTSLGHQASAFQDANVKKHVAAGIMWAARREHLLVP